MSALWLKAITCLNLVDFTETSAEALAEKLQAQRFSPCTSVERERHGFVPAFEQEALVRKVKDVFWMQIMSEVKPIPGAVVKRLLRDKVEKVEKEEIRKVSKKEKKEFKEVIVDELVANAVPVQSTLTIMLDPVAKLIVFSSTSNKRVEHAMTLLLRCLDNLNMSRMQFAKTIQGQMSALLLDEDSSIFKTDSSLVLKGPGSPAASVRFSQHSLAGPEVITHLNAGLRPVALELGWLERLSFVLTDTFEIKKLTFLELVTKEFEESAPEDPEALIDGMLMLQNGELREMVAELSAWFGGAADEAAGTEQAAAPEKASA